MVDYDKHSNVVAMLGDAQKGDKDERDNAREAENFLSKKDGQWEPEIYHQYKKNSRPRYTLDKCNPIVSQIAGQLKLTNFGIKVNPANDESNEDIAKIMAGMVRNIQRVSQFPQITSVAARNMVATGIDGWMITQDWAEGAAFHQDLFIKPVYSFVDSVWFDPNSQRRDRSDAKWAVKLTAMSKQAYDAKFPEGSGQSINQDRSSNSYANKPDQVVVGEFYWVEEVTDTLYLMNDGSVYSQDDFDKYGEQFAARGLSVERTRKHKKRVVKFRQLDGGDWLSDEKETVFNWIPIIPTYGNYNVVENKLIFKGVVEPLMDGQRIYNYARSRQIEEGALSPRDKYWMTPEQAEGHESSLETMNTNSEAVQFYNSVENAAPPYKGGTAMVNPSLEATAQSANQDITQAGGVFASNLGDNPRAQSGVAIDALQSRGDVVTVEYYEAMEVAIEHTCRILINAIPKVYDGTRIVRILGEDGMPENVDINRVAVNPETGRPEVVNDISKGRYEISCSAGKSFDSRQQESISAILEVAALDPSIIQEGADILLKNTNAPGLDVLAERRRAALFNAGLIPKSQWTEEETQAVQQAQLAAQGQPQEQDPNMILAMAEQTKAQADLLAEENKNQKLMVDTQLAQSKQSIEVAKIQSDIQKNQVDAFHNQQKIDQGQQKIDQDGFFSAQSNKREEVQTSIDLAQAIQGLQKTQAEMLLVLKDVMGVSGVVSPTLASTFQEQADKLDNDELGIVNPK